jgi:hypothetical protein
LRTQSGRGHLERLAMGLLPHHGYIVWRLGHYNEAYRCGNSQSRDGIYGSTIIYIGGSHSAEFVKKL